MEKIRGLFHSASEQLTNIKWMYKKVTTCITCECVHTHAHTLQNENVSAYLSLCEV